jgi:S-adenosylmethionine synthetase
VSIRYVDGKSHSIDTAVLSTQHDPEIFGSQACNPERRRGFERFCAGVYVDGC